MSAKFQNAPMSENKPSRTIFIRENTRLPASVTLESEPFLPGWRSIKNLDGRELGRKIENAKWNYFYLAGPLKATVLGRESLATLRKAVQQVLAKKQSQNYNSLEVSKIISKRFLGVPYLTISAHSRHIQEGMYLVPVKEFRLRDAADVTTTPKVATVFGSVEKVPQE
jgi:hypothetical protein